MGLSKREVAGLPNGGGVTIEKALRREPHPHTAKGVGLQCVPPPPCVSLWADGVEDEERKGVSRDEEAHFVVGRGPDDGPDYVVRERGGVC